MGLQQIMIHADSLIPPVLDLDSAEPEIRLQAVKQIVRLGQLPGFLKTLREHRLTPLIYQNLASYPRKEVGDVPLFEELRRDYLSFLRLYRVQDKETRQLMEVLNAAGVDVIFLKGADIRHRLYNDPATRPMNDIDVLISPADQERTRIALEQQGYRLICRHLDLRPGFCAQFGWARTYKPPTRGSPLVDVHWGIYKVGTFYRMPYGPLRARATIRDLRSLPVLILVPEHVIMHLCLHTFNELESATILQIVDLDRALHRFSVDWDFFLQEVARFRIQAPVLYIFRELERLHPSSLPDSVLKKLIAYSPGWTERLILIRQANSTLVASLMALWHHLPVSTWPAYLKAKIWPTREYLKANARTFPSRIDYLSHILGRARGKTK